MAAADLVTGQRWSRQPQSSMPTYLPRRRASAEAVVVEGVEEAYWRPSSSGFLTFGPPDVAQSHCASASELVSVGTVGGW